MKSLVVSVHDVSPLTFATTRQILEDLRRVGIEKTALLVIPDHHRRGHFLKDREFCRWLRELANAGHEIVAHGYFHLRERTGKESARAKMITRFYTDGEGEFYDISKEDALDKMGRALADFETLGLRPAGFIAPAWLLSAAAEEAARKSGFLYTTTLQECRNLVGKCLPARSQSLVYSVRSAWRRVASIAWNRSLLGRLEENPLARLGIHPPDWEFEAIRREILLQAAYLRTRRLPGTYQEWMTR